jgi:beta-lactamase class A
MKKASLFLLIAIGLSVGTGYAVGLSMGKATAKSTLASAASQQIRLSGTQYTSPLLLGDVSNDKDSPTLADLSSQVQAIIRQGQKDGSLITASVFYRTLQGGNQITVNDSEKYFPASLTKVPLMMAYFKLSESDPDLLTIKGKIDFQVDYNAGQELTPKEAPISGREYSIDELIVMMIHSSDNISFNLLINDPKAQDDLKKLYGDFQLYYPFNGQLSDVMTARDMSRFFRALYNSTYLSIVNSDKALKLLVESDFDKGLVAGVPKNAMVADKFGLSTNYDATGKVVTQRELHDCGIVYRPKQPYVACIMTKSGADLTRIEAVIKNISSVLYNAPTK